ncbi:helix-turn-helix domain-containing protein [Weissella kandleri]|uniref:helix-turn-helix domain-containing protein n=1 Tax=Weissella kandleri TaxID=1616 RepID=UPI00070BBAEE|nr:helix-turn-helix transcriptional regulator [Weissella kandleri]
MNRIKELRESQKISQTSLAWKLDMPQNTISQWESGKRKPSRYAVKFLADYFKVSSDYLMGYEE